MAHRKRVQYWQIKCFALLPQSVYQRSSVEFSVKRQKNGQRFSLLNFGMIGDALRCLQGKLLLLLLGKLFSALAYFSTNSLPDQRVLSCKGHRKNQRRECGKERGISEMPPQAVTLEPMVQGERSVTIFRLLGGPSMRTDCGSSHSVGTNYRLRGRARWQTSQRNFCVLL
jgi:hypothetical protein